MVSDLVSEGNKVTPKAGLTAEFTGFDPEAIKEPELKLKSIFATNFNQLKLTFENEIDPKTLVSMDQFICYEQNNPANSLSCSSNICFASLVSITFILI